MAFSLSTFYNPAGGTGPSPLLIGIKNAPVVTYEGSKILVIRSGPFFNAVEGSISELSGLTARDIASMVGTAVKYAEILKQRAMEDLSKMLLYKGTRMVIPGIHDAGNGTAAVLGASITPIKRRETKLQILMKKLPIGGCSPHIVGGNALISFIGNDKDYTLVADALADNITLGLIIHRRLAFRGTYAGIVRGLGEYPGIAKVIVSTIHGADREPYEIVFTRDSMPSYEEFSRLYSSEPQEMHIIATVERFFEKHGHENDICAMILVPEISGGISKYTDELIDLLDSRTRRSSLATTEFYYQIGLPQANKLSEPRYIDTGVRSSYFDGRIPRYTFFNGLGITGTVLKMFKFANPCVDGVVVGHVVSVTPILRRVSYTGTPPELIRDAAEYLGVKSSELYVQGYDKDAKRPSFFYSSDGYLCATSKTPSGIKGFFRTTANRKLREGDMLLAVTRASDASPVTPESLLAM